MAKTVTVKAAGVIGTRTYAFERETKGCWVYMWADAPDETPDWAKKWYILKADFETKPGKQLQITMAA